MLDMLVLVVAFTSGQFRGSESWGFIDIVVEITGGSSSTPITVTVAPSVQSPVSLHQLQVYQHKQSVYNRWAYYRPEPIMLA